MCSLHIDLQTREARVVTFFFFFLSSANAGACFLPFGTVPDLSNIHSKNIKYFLLRFV